MPSMIGIAGQSPPTHPALAIGPRTGLASLQGSES